MKIFPALWFEKRVIIVNGRLQAAYFCFTVLIFLAICFKVYRTGELYTEYFENDQLTVSLFPSADYDIIHSVEKGLTPYCDLGENTGMSYSYALGKRQYTNYTCKYATSSGDGPADMPLEALYQQDVGGTVMIKTQGQSVYFSPGDTRSKASNTKFYPGAEGVTVSISYSYKIPKYDMYGNRFPRNAMEGSSETQKTGLKDDQREDLDALDSGVQTMEFTISELLTYAGVREVLDQGRPIAGANEDKTSSFLDGPPGRISGMGLNIEVSCFNDPNKIPETVLPVPVSGVGCFLQVVHTNEAWVEASSTSFDGQNWVFESFRGIRLKGVSRVEVKFFNFLNAFNNLIAFIVLLQFPRVITRFLACRCLGMSGKFITRATNEEFNIKHQLGAAVARLICYGAQFLELSDPDKNNRQCIDEAMVMDRITSVLARPGKNMVISHADSVRFAHGCFKSIADSEINRDAGGGGEKIFATAFFEALTQGDNLRSTDVVDLANTRNGKRKPGFIEAIFLTEPFKDVVYHHASDTNNFVAPEAKKSIDDKMKKNDMEKIISSLPPDEAEKERERKDQEKITETTNRMRATGKRPQTLEERKEAIWRNFQLVTDLTAKQSLDHDETRHLIEQMNAMVSKLETQMDRQVTALEVKFEATRASLHILEAGIANGAGGEADLANAAQIAEQQILRGGQGPQQVVSLQDPQTARTVGSASSAPVDGASQNDSGRAGGGGGLGAISTEFAEAIEGHVHSAKREAAKSSARVALVAAGTQVSLRLLSERLQAQLVSINGRLDEIEGQDRALGQGAGRLSQGKGSSDRNIRGIETAVLQSNTPRSRQLAAIEESSPSNSATPTASQGPSQILGGSPRTNRSGYSQSQGGNTPGYSQSQGGNTPGQG